MGWSVTEEFIDEGVSAYSGANLYEGHLSRLRDRFTRDGGDGIVLVVEQLDRLSRLDALTVIEFFIAMTRTRLTIAMADSRMIVDANSLRNQTAQLEEIVRESQRANREGRVKSARSRGAWDKMRETGIKVHTSATCPAWLYLSSDRRSFGINHERADIVRGIFRDYIAGISKRNIARGLNEDGVKPFRGAKLGWQPTAIIALLNNRGVMGEYQHQSRSAAERIGDPIPDYFPEIVDNATWQAAHDVRQSKVMKGRGREIHHRNILQDIAVCHECGSRMAMNRKTARTKASYVTTYLQCISYSLRTGCGHKKMHRLDRIETPLLDRLLTLGLDDQVWSDGATITPISARLADQRRELDDLTTRVENLLRELERRPSDHVSKRLEELESEEQKLLAKIVEGEQELAVAKGAVSPAEHLRRVDEIRGNMTRDDDEGTKSRKVIKVALNDLIDEVRIDSVGNAFVHVKEGLRLLIIRPDGKAMDFDLKHPVRAVATTDPAVVAYLERRKLQL